MIKDMIAKYNIRLTTHNGDVALRLGHTPTAADRQYIVDNKQNIISILQQQAEEAQAARAARQAKIDAIEGLSILQDAIYQWRRYYAAQERRYDDESMSSISITPPEVSVNELKQKYPRADAYLKALDYSNAANAYKAIAGQKALERIINGEDHQTALEDMEREWTEAAMRNMFD